jgi:hypothetical protein
VADDSEVRGEGGKGKVCYPRSSRGDRRKQSRFSYVGEADQTNVGQEAQFELKEAFFSRGAGLGKARCLVRRSGKKSIAFAALSPASDDDLRALRTEISQKLTALGVTNQGAQWHADDEVVTVFPVLILSSTVFATLGSQVTLIDEVAQGAQLGISLKDDTPAVSAIPAVWPPSRTVFFAQEADATAAAIPGFHVDSDFINKMHTSKKAPCGALGQGRSGY